MSKSNKKGFTIVELLVVIVVIGILATITIVSLSGVTNKANTNADLATASSIRTAAMVVYTKENKYPTESADPLGALTAGDAKLTLPSGATLSNAKPTGKLTFSYRVASSGKGICIGYWDSTLSTPAAVFITDGTATAASDGTCS